MDFRSIFQLRSKKIWWVDVIFYFTTSLLVATFLCWLIFIVKISMQKQELSDLEKNLETVGTQQQKQQEKEVLLYQRKIADFKTIFQNHNFPSEAFAFLEKQTLPYIWFKNFSFDRENAVVRVSGEADDLEAFSRQVASLERNQNVKKLEGLNSSLGEAARASFSYSMSFDPKILKTSDILKTETSSSEQTVQPEQETPQENQTE